MKEKIYKTNFKIQNLEIVNNVTAKTEKNSKILKNYW